MDLRRVDLSLLPVLRDLLRTKSTTLTAKRLGITQSTVSHSLARLRAQFADPLLVRVGRSLSPTPFAETLTTRLEEALDRISGLFDARASFAPAALHRAFAFASTDFCELVVLPTVVRRLAREAPGVDLVCSAAGAEVERKLQEREVDLAFGTAFRERSGIVSKTVARDELVLVVRKGHPLRNALALGSYAGAGHVLVAPRGAAGGPIDLALAARGLARRVVVRVSHFATAAALVSETDLVSAMPRSCARAMAKRLPIVVRAVPLPLPPFVFSIAWNEQLSSDPAHQWFRGIVGQAAARALGGSV